MFGNYRGDDVGYDEGCRSFGKSVRRKSMFQDLKRFERDESGATLVEYIVMVAIAILVGGPIVLALFGFLDDIVDAIGAWISDNLGISVS